MRHPVRAYYDTEFRSILKEAAASEALLEGILYIILTSGGPGVPDAYKRNLNAVNQSLMEPVIIGISSRF